MEVLKYKQILIECGFIVIFRKIFLYERYEMELNFQCNVDKS